MERRSVEIANGDRFYNYLWTIQVGWAMFYNSLEKFLPELVGTERFAVHSRQKKLNLIMPRQGVMESALQNLRPSHIWFKTRPGLEPDIPASMPDILIMDTGDAVGAMMNASFCMFVEQCNGWVAKNSRTTTIVGHQLLTSVASFEMQ